MFFLLFSLNTGENSSYQLVSILLKFLLLMIFFSSLQGMLLQLVTIFLKQFPHNTDQDSYSYFNKNQYQLQKQQLLGAHKIQTAQFYANSKIKQLFNLSKAAYTIATVNYYIINFKHKTPKIDSFLQMLKRKVQSRNKQSSLFSISLKISGRQIEVPVYQEDTHDTLAQRVCDNHIFSSQYKSTVKYKIIQSLESIITSGKVSEALKSKVHNFLGQNYKKNQHKYSISHTCRNKNSPVKHTYSNYNYSSQRISENITDRNKKSAEKYTPFKLIQESDINLPSRRSPNRHINSQCTQGLNFQQNSSYRYSTRKNKSKQRVNSKGILRKNQNNLIHTQKNHFSNSNIYKSRKNKSSADPDLIKAYQIIYKKSRQPEIKNMAKKFLQNCGKITNQNANFSNIQSQRQRERQKQKSAQKSAQRPEEHNQSLPLSYNIPGQVDFSLTKIQAVVQPFDSQVSETPLRYHANSKSRSRIKYDIEQYEVNQKSPNRRNIKNPNKYIHNNLDNSLLVPQRYTRNAQLTKYEYLKNTSYPSNLPSEERNVHRASISYDRLPAPTENSLLMNHLYYGAEKVTDPGCIRNRNSLSIDYGVDRQRYLLENRHVSSGSLLALCQKNKSRKYSYL